MAEISVTGGVFATLTPIFTLWYGHKDITYDITPYVTSISYHDSIKNESDTIAITLDDTDGRWIKRVVSRQRRYAGAAYGLSGREAARLWSVYY